jgi:hypothetical protein
MKIHRPHLEMNGIRGILFTFMIVLFFMSSLEYLVHTGIWKCSAVCMNACNIVDYSGCCMEQCMMSCH